MPEQIEWININDQEFDCSDQNTQEWPENSSSNMTKVFL